MKVINPQSLFPNLVDYQKEDDTHHLTCPLGLWGVSAPDYATAYREAYHYFIQYLNDGEYDSLIHEKHL